MISYVCSQIMLSLAAPVINNNQVKTILELLLSLNQDYGTDYGTFVLSVLKLDYGTFVLSVLKLSSKLPISGLLSDDTIRVTHEFVTPRYLATSAPV